MPVSLLGAADIRRLAAELDVTPTKKLGQNFVVDANTVRKIVHVARVAAEPVRAPRTRASEQPDEQVETAAPETAKKPAPQKAAPVAPATAPIPAPSRAAVSEPELAAPQKKPTGRISRGLGLICAGIRTLFSGK